jgi:hypothetical protein
MPKKLFFSFEEIDQLCHENGSKLLKVHTCKNNLIDLKTEITFTCVQCHKHIRKKISYVRYFKKFKCKDHHPPLKDYPKLTHCSNPNGYSVSSGRPALYIVEIPHLTKIKFGCTNNLSTRIKKHENDFRNIVIVYILETDNVLMKESLLKQELRANGINTVSEYNGKKYTEMVNSDCLTMIQNLMSEIVHRKISYDWNTFIQMYLLKKLELDHAYRMKSFP